MGVQRISLLRPDDWHLHVRDGAALQSVVPVSAARFGRAVVMPNLRPPVATVADAMAYRERILAACPPDAPFCPLMTLYLTPHTSPDEIVRAARSDHVLGVKLYPAGATTHSEAGVRDLASVWPALEAMAQLRVPLLVHGEDTDPTTDVFDREAVFLDRVLHPLLERLPELRVVLEHVTTAEGVAAVRAAGDGVAATVTPHHLWLDRNAMFRDGFRPHAYCLPVLKRERHRLALVEAVTSGHPRFFLGTDSAPHPRSHKECGVGCAGIYNAPVALEVYAAVFEAAGALDRLEDFASRFGPRFHGLPENTDRIALVREPWSAPETCPLGDDTVVPLAAGSELAWRWVEDPGP
jgi:dihydroorotase